jgi:hypothetical protein
MASKFRTTSAQSKKMPMLSNNKINNIQPMENTLYSASPGGEKNRWYKIQSTVNRTARYV